MFEAHFLTITCPECEHSISRPVRRAMARQRATCDACGHVVPLDDDAGRARLMTAEHDREDLVERQRIVREGRGT
ncbi:hypothetical protein C2I36_00635 [Rhodobacteraceae bacterium WD3A24]|nr:hypothetical protein C2I36_00635 [Rhodobacteraceae bacterium WD3A24]